MLKTDQLREVDEDLLEYLRDGRVTPIYAKRRMDNENVRDVTSTYLQQRLKRLGEHGHVRNLFDTGLYELVDDPFEVDELTDELADATGTTPEEIERGAEDVDMAPPVERCGSCEAQEMIANAN